MASVYFDPAVGRDGTTVTDDGNPSTGLASGGHRMRFVPALAQLVAVADYTVTAVTGIDTDVAAATAAAASATSSASAAAASASAAASFVGGVKVTTSDTGPTVLDSAIVVSGNLTKTVLNPGGDEQLQLSVSVPVTSVAGKTGAVTLNSGDVGLASVENKSSATIRSEINSGNVTGALGYTPQNAATAWNTSNFDPSTKSNTSHTHTNLVSTDNGNNNVGSLVFAVCGPGVVPGDTVAGGVLNPAGIRPSYDDGAFHPADLVVYGAALSGTWRALGYSYSGAATLFQRIS